jgi:hypothetical protein
LIGLFLALLIVIAFSGIATPQSAAPEDSIAAELVGAGVFAADGSEVGQVAAVSIGTGGEISEIRITTASPLGVGERTVVLPRGSYIVLRGAVVVDLSRAELDSLPSAGSQSGKRQRVPA